MKTAPEPSTPTDPAEEPPTPPLQRRFLTTAALILVLAPAITAALLRHHHPGVAAGTSLVIAVELLFVAVLTTSAVAPHLAAAAGFPTLTPRDERETLISDRAHGAAFTALVTANLIGGILFHTPWALYLTVAAQIGWFAIRWYDNRRT